MAIQANAGDIVRAVVRFAHPDLSAVENVFHYILQGTGTAIPDDVITTVAASLEDIYGFIQSYMHEDTTLESVLCNLAVWAVDHWLNVGNLGDAASLISFTPAATSDPLPDACAGLIRHVTDVPRRTGAKYYAPLSEAVVSTDGKLNSTYVAAALNSGLDYIATSDAVPDSSLTLQAAIVSPVEDVWTPPSGVISRSEVAYQRRRKSLIGL